MSESGRRLVSVMFVLTAPLVAVPAIVCGAETATAWSNTIDERSGLVPLDQIVPEIEKECQTSERVTIRVRTQRGRFATTINCGVVRSLGTAVITDELVSAAGTQDQTAMKADRILALAHTLIPDVTYDRDELIWGLATGPGLGCERAERPSEIRANMTAAGQVAQETPEHWTLVEAVTIAAVCPRQLAALYRNVSRVGEPEAAAAAKDRVEQALKGLTHR